MSKNTGGSAFPNTHVVGMGETPGWYGCSGMTLRDYFAAKAMAKLIDSEKIKVMVQIVEDKRTVFEIISTVAYSYADAMLKARNE